MVIGQNSLHHLNLISRGVGGVNVEWCRTFKQVNFKWLKLNQSAHGFLFKQKSAK